MRVNDTLFVYSFQLPESLQASSQSSCLYFLLPSSSSHFSSFSECWVGSPRRPHPHSHCNLPNPTSPLKPPHVGAAQSRACDLPVFQSMDWHPFTLSRAIPTPSLVDPARHPDVIPVASVEYPPPSVVFTVNRRITARKSTAHR
jgi:hypothetical protein